MIKYKVKELPVNRFYGILASLIMVISAFQTVLSDPYEYAPADRGKFEPKSGTAILPQSFLREYDPVTVFFTGKRGPEKTGSEDNGEQYLKIIPKHPGEYIWIDEKTLEFRPTIPWPPVSHFNIEADGVKKKLATILTPPQSIQPSSGSTDLGSVNEITLEFAYPVDPDMLKKLVVFESTPLPGIDRSQSVLYTAVDYTIKTGEQKSSGAVPYTFIFSQPFPLGHKIRTTVTLSDIPEFSEGKRTYFFETKAEFRLLRAGTYNNLLSLGSSGSHYTVDNALPMDGESRIVLEFSSRPKELSLSQAKSLFTFSPVPETFSYSQSGNRVTANIKLEAERIYKVTLQPIPVTDQSGRTLIMSGPSSFYCYRNPDKQYLRWPESFNILERFGPQHIPLQISNIGSFDLRIYKIDPLNKAFWPFPSSSFSVNEGDRPPGPGEEPEMESDIKYPLSSQNMIKHIKMLGSPHFSTVIDAQKEGILKNQTLNLRAKLETISGKEQPGTYLIGLRELNGGNNRQYVKVQVTDLCLSTVESKTAALFCVTSLKSGKAISGATVAVEGLRGNEFVRLHSENTDSRGMCSIPGGVLYDSIVNIQLRRVVIKKDSDCLVLDIQNGVIPNSFANNHWSSSGNGWLSLLKNKEYKLEKDRVWKGFVFPERPIYRPEDTIYFKGFVRSVFQGQYFLPERDTVELEISGPDNTWNIPLKTSKLGSFSYVFNEEQPATGDYTVRLKYDPPQKNQYRKVLSEANFRIDAYRIPRFEVKLNGPDQIPNDQPFTVNVSASYYAGGSVVDCPVRWRVQAFPYSWSVNGWKGYYLSSDNRFSRSMSSAHRNTIDEEGRLNDQGIDKLIIKADAALGGNPTKYVVEATVTDVDEQTVTDSKSTISLPPFVLALKADRYISQGSTISASLAAIDVHEKALSGQKVTVALKKKTWNHFLQETDFARSEPKYITEENVTVIEEREVTTGASPVDIVFKNRDPGVYIIDLSSKDKLGRLQTLQLDLFLAGDKSVVWKKSEQDVFETVTDKAAYVPGDRATIIIKSPYQNAMALAVVEKPDGIPDYQWVTVSNGQGTFSLDITAEMVDRIPVSFLLMRPRVSDAVKMPEGNFVDVGKPKTEANTTWLTVKPTANRVTVLLDHQKVYAPGDTMYIDISLTDWKNKPLDGEVCLWLVDQAVLSLGEEMSLDPVPSFIDPVSSHIAIRDSRNLVRGMICDFEAFGGDEEEEMDDGENVTITVRKNFKTIPYYNPSISVDKNGKKRIAVPLPDNLTRFAVRAVAVSGVQKFGFVKSQISIRIPVIVEPSLPRFVRTGDRFVAGGIARIVEGSGGDGFYSIKTDGLTIEKNKGKDGWVPFTFPDKKALPLYIEMQVPTPGYDDEGRLKRDSISLQMAVRKAKSNKGDAFEVKIPLLTDREPVTREIISLMPKDSAVVFPGITEKLRPNTLMRQVTVCDRIVKVISALRYLIEYPHGCAEQRVSRVYPSVAYQDVWKKLQIDNPDPKVKQYVNETLQYLASCQDDNGLFGYWPGNDGQVHLTAYIVEFLALVKETNSDNSFKLSQSMYDRAIKALEQSLRSDYTRFLSGQKYLERCAAIYALVKAGKKDMSYLKQLANEAKDADLISQARIYSAIVQSEKPMENALKDLEKDLWKYTVFKKRDGQEVFAGLQDGKHWFFPAVHVTDVASLASLVGALSLKNTNPLRVGMMIDELLDQGSNGGWGSTHDNSLVLLALRDRLKSTADTKRSASLSLSYGEKQKDLTYKENSGMLKFSFDSPHNAFLTFAEKKSTLDNVYVHFFERYLPLGLGSEVAAAQEGFVVKRQLIFPSDSGGPSKKIWKVAEMAAKNQWSYPQYLLQLAESELLLRNQRSIERRIKAARF
ncbi:MAG: hypothetical protein GX640_12700, partial [Fibrobacter sp.]|nr:hypothetical protein [Fibrobacter sp.]